MFDSNVEIEIERFVQLRMMMQAFDMREIQTFAVISSWARDSKVTQAELCNFAQVLPVFSELERMGYFRFMENHPIPLLRTFRMMEQALPKSMRVQLRRAKFKYIKNGRLGGG
jgi:hypothetical protein